MSSSSSRAPPADGGRGPDGFAGGLAGEPFDDVALAASAVVDFEVAADLLQAVAGELGEDVLEPGLVRGAEGLDEIGADASVVDLELVGVEGVEELIAFELFEDPR